MNTQPKLTLVGAGPGDPELITLKGVKALRNAQVILYDALVNTTLLDYAPNALKIYVGKRANKHTFTQDVIHQMIVQYAYKYGHVVRLKGGDSFVFGRGSEEINYAKLFCIKTEVIPGISSAFSVPASIGIPATERGVSEGVWVITGTTTKRDISKDIHLAAQSNSTIVILMGIKNLSNIVKAFKNEGKINLPIAIIQNGTLPQQREVIGTISNIEQQANEANIGAPAIIIIGEVVNSNVALRTVIEQQISFN
ncbi:uroporphyrinogen-III C-methyltransferase [Paucihalobacter sp.]|uniref:uroporphyrinogen-III C-methyltransferase n=1 Tax=Paucihalobacter sp. TaxID=2850405 RepID=UPI002FE186BF